MASATTLALLCLTLSTLSAVSAQVTGVMSYYPGGSWTCGGGGANTDTVATVSPLLLKNGGSCGQCIQVSDAAGSFPTFTAQLVSQDSQFSGTDFGVAHNFGGPYAVAYSFVDCAAVGKLLGSTTSATPTPSATPSDTTASTNVDGYTATSTLTQTPTQSAAPTPVPTITPAVTTAPATASAATTSSSSSGLGSAVQSTCTGQGTYYSQPQSPSTFYCLGRGLAGPYAGLPTVALNGADMSDDDCGKCVVLQGTGISAAASSAAGQGTTPFPAVPNYATIDNKCPECSHCDIDYYTGYTQTKNGRYTITWEFIDCAQAVQLYNAQAGGSGRKLLRNNSPALRTIVA